MSIEESTDVEERYVANIFIGTLELDSQGKHFLINTVNLEKITVRFLNFLIDPVTLFSRTELNMTTYCFY